MFQQYDFNTWRELEDCALSLASKSTQSSSEQPGYRSEVLFRGQASYGWSLDTTLQRQAPRLTRLADYYRLAAIAKTQIESLTSRKWPDIDAKEVGSDLESYDYLRLNPMPHHEYLVYLRHHGFPSPLLDWSRSLYVAAFFAFAQPMSERVAIFVYQEYAGTGKASSSAEGQIHTLGPNIRTHQRHFLQQAEYTSALEFVGGSWRLADHMDVMIHGQENQDHLWKLTAPASDTNAVIRQLESYNINAYSLFQSEDALLATLSSRLITNGSYA